MPAIIPIVIRIENRLLINKQHITYVIGIRQEKFYRYLIQHQMIDAVISFAIRTIDQYSYKRSERKISAILCSDLYFSEKTLFGYHFLTAKIQQ